MVNNTVILATCTQVLYPLKHVHRAPATKNTNAYMLGQVGWNEGEENTCGRGTLGLALGTWHETPVSPASAVFLRGLPYFTFGPAA